MRSVLSLLVDSNARATRRAFTKLSSAMWALRQAEVQAHHEGRHNDLERQMEAMKHEGNMRSLLSLLVDQQARSLRRGFVSWQLITVSLRHDDSSEAAAAAHARERALLEGQLDAIQKESQMRSTLQLLVDSQTRCQQKAWRKWWSAVEAHRREEFRARHVAEHALLESQLVAMKSDDRMRSTLQLLVDGQMRLLRKGFLQWQTMAAVLIREVMSAEEAAAHAQERTLLEAQLAAIKEEARARSTLQMLVDMQARATRRAWRSWCSATERLRREELQAHSAERHTDLERQMQAMREEGRMRSLLQLLVDGRCRAMRRSLVCWHTAAIALRHAVASAEEAAAHARERALLERQLADFKAETRKRSVLQLLVDAHARFLRQVRS